MDIRERIINACRGLTLNQGLRRFTMDALASQAGVSKRTVYRYFDSKEAVIEATLDDFMQRTAAEVKQMLMGEQNPLVIFNNLLKYLCLQGQFVINPATLNDLRLYYPQLWSKIDAFRLKHLHSVLNRLMAANPSLLQDIDPRVLTAVLTAVIQNVLNPDFILENNLTFEETARQLSLIFSTFFTSPS
jgi:AcrR family transcriptional regulator